MKNVVYFTFLGCIEERTMIGTHTGAVALDGGITTTHTEATMNT